MQDRTKHFVDVSGIHAYHTSNSRECMGVNGQALQLRAVYKKPYFLLQVMRESVSVLQVTRESISVLQLV